MADRARVPASRQGVMPRRVRQSGHDPMTGTKKPPPVYFKSTELENIRCFEDRQRLVKRVVWNGTFLLPVDVFYRKSQEGQPRTAALRLSWVG